MLPNAHTMNVTQNIYWDHWALQYLHKMRTLSWPDGY